MLPQEVHDLVDLPLEEVELVLVEGGGVHGEQEDRAVHRDLVPEGLHEPQHRDEIVVRDQVLDPVNHDNPLLLRDELLQGEGELLEVLRADRVLLPDVAQPEDRDPGEAELLPYLVREGPRDAEPLQPAPDRPDE